MSTKKVVRNSTIIKWYFDMLSVADEEDETLDWGLKDWVDSFHSESAQYMLLGCAIGKGKLLSEIPNNIEKGVLDKVIETEYNKRFNKEEV